jgi:hypothetical protein
VSGEPWAKVPEWAIGLSATEYDVFIVFSSRAGRTREAWVSQTTVAMLITREREAKGKPGVSRATVGRAVKRLVAYGLMREVGIVVNNDGVWTKKYEVAPYLGVAHPERASSGSDAHFGGHDAHFEANDAHPERAQSSRSKAVPLNSEISNEELRETNDEWADRIRRSNEWYVPPEEQEPHRRKEAAPNPATDVVIPEEVSPRG